MYVIDMQPFILLLHNILHAKQVKIVQKGKIESHLNMSPICQPMPEIRGVSKEPQTFGCPVDHSC